MILVIGGLASGKKEYVKREYGFCETDIADGILDNRPVLYNLQNLVFDAADTIEAMLPILLGKEVVICNEVGSGVVPVNKTERVAREATGRLCVALAEHAEKVVRLCCGIPTVIKEL